MKGVTHVTHDHQRTQVEWHTLVPAHGNYLDPIVKRLREIKHQMSHAQALSIRAWPQTCLPGEVSGTSWQHMWGCLSEQLPAEESGPFDL